MIESIYILYTIFIIKYVLRLILNKTRLAHIVLLSSATYADDNKTVCAKRVNVVKRGEYGTIVKLQDFFACHLKKLLFKQNLIKTASFVEKSPASSPL